MIAAAIVDEDEFERLLRGLHDCLQAVVELRNILLFVVKRDYYRVLKHSLTIIQFQLERLRGIAPVARK